MAQNDHSLSSALNPNRLAPAFIEAASKAWCKDTCWDGCKDGYPADRNDNSSFGNCFITILAAWADRGFRDEILPGLVYEPGRDNPSWHFRMRIDGIEVDPTWQQFEKGARFIELQPGGPMYERVIKGSVFEDQGLRPRLETFLRRLDNPGGYSGMPEAALILEKLEARFAAFNRPAPYGPHL